MKLLKNLRTALLAVLLLISVNIIYGEQVAKAQRAIADELIRFHVRANSDSEADQQLKLEVKDAVVDYMQVLLADSKDVRESEEIIRNNMENILQVAMGVIHDRGYEYDLTGYMTQEYFPLKTYGDVALPPGEYEAFRIDIGAAEGKNWWCVLYPPLCFVDVTHGVVPETEKQEFEKILAEEDYELMDTYSFEFKYLKFLNKYFTE